MKNQAYIPLYKKVGEILYQLDKKDYIEKILRVREPKYSSKPIVYRFDKNGIWEEKEKVTHNFTLGNSNRDDISNESLLYRIVSELGPMRGYPLQCAITGMKVGDKIEDLVLRYVKSLYYYKKTRMELPNGLSEFITKIDRPDVRRSIDNPNKNTFDFVEVYIHVIQLKDNRMEYIKQNLKHINRIAINAIKMSGVLDKYNVPINFLKLSRYVLTRQSELMLQYELKNTDKTVT